MYCPALLVSLAGQAGQGNTSLTEILMSAKTCPRNFQKISTKCLPQEDVLVSYNGPHDIFTTACFSCRGGVTEVQKNPRTEGTSDAREEVGEG